MTRHAARLLVGSLVVGGILGAAGPVAAADGPSVSLQRSSAAPGATVLVAAGGWPPGSVVTVNLCGNDALRGSQDCDLVAGQSVHIRGAAPEYVLLPIALPPAPCPCVVRASDVTGLIIATAPFGVVGAPTAPTVAPTAAVAAVPLTVTAQVHDPRGSFLDRLRHVLGGPSRRELVLELRNTGSTPLTGVVVTAALGRHPTGGAPLDAPAAIDVGPGERRTVSLPFKLEAPVHGRYVLAGSVFTGGQPVAFSTTVQVTPWGLVVLALLVGMAVAAGVVLAVRRRRQRARRPAGDDGEHQVTGSETLGEHPLPDPDPEQVLS